MVEILRFNDVAQRRTHSRTTRMAPDTFSFWPEVACGLWVTGSQAVDPANTPRRVFSEILLILGVAGAIAATISLFVAAPPLT
jgi:hypothetical protein